MRNKMDTETEQKSELSCGKFVFRGKELAYLNIGGEQMLSLAQLLSSFFPVTPRTTLFTRMKKIHARRHFCNAMEIKLLKTVGGCHGSSANCTVIPKSDVENYCKTYMDPTKSLTKDIKEQLFELNKDVELSLTKSSKSLSKNNKELQPLARSPTVCTEELNSIFKVNRKRSRKNAMFDRSFSKAVINNKRELEISPETGNSLCEFAAIDMNVSNIHAFEGSNGGHVTNSTQTPSMLNQLFKTKKFSTVRRKVQDSINLKPEAVKQRRKQRLSSGGDKEKLRGPSTQCKCEAGSNEVSMTNEGFEFSHLVISDMEKYEKFSIHSGELKSPFSDVSSNDSGFSSTTSKKFCPNKIKSEVESKSDEFATKGYSSNLKKSSPLNKRKRSPKKERELLKARGSISLSPPALVIRRCDNTWQVETKINKANTDNVRKKLKLGKSSKATLKLENLNTDRNDADKVISAQEAIEISNAVLPAKNLFTQCLPQKREKKVFEMIKASNVKRAKQIPCKKRTQDISLTSNMQPECVMEPVKEDEGPLIDRGIFPMKRRRRRRSKIEMQEVRRQQAIKKALREAKREGKVLNDAPNITEFNIHSDQNMNNLLKKSLSPTKEKKEKKKKKTVIENKQPEDVPKKASAAKQGSLDLVSVSEENSFGSSTVVKPKEKSEISRNSHSKEKFSSGDISAEKTKKDFVDLKKPTISKTKDSVKHIPVKSSLNVNSKFKLTSLFNGFPLLTVQGGSLCPAYSHVYSKEEKVPGPDHLLWKWHLGEPVFDKLNSGQCKTGKISQNKTHLTSSKKMLSKAKKQKAKKLPRELSKRALFKKLPPSGNIVVDSKLSCDNTLESNPAGSTKSSADVNICNNDESESKPLSSILTSVSKISLFEKSSCLCPSSVSLMDSTTSCVAETNTQVNISNFIDNAPQMQLTLSKQLQTIAAET